MYLNYFMSTSMIKKCKHNDLDFITMIFFQTFTNFSGSKLGFYDDVILLQKPDPEISSDTSNYNTPSDSIPNSGSFKIQVFCDVRKFCGVTLVIVVTPVLLV